LSGSRTFLAKRSEAVEAVGAALSENPLIGPAFASMMINFTPQADWVRLNAAYK
jgi:hypothetical protein